MRKTILGFSIAGTLLFGIAFALSWLNPIWIERVAGTALRIEVEREAEARIDALLGAPIAGLAQRALGRVDADMARTREAIRQDVPARVAQVVAAMRDADCDCRRRLASALDAGARQHLLSLSQVRARLAGLVESAYANVRVQLLRELRIFTASNAIAFALMGVIALARPGAGLQLVLPAAALAGGIMVTAGLYLFGQDWLHTILFNDYVGLAYAGWMGAVVLLLADILANRARITTRMVNGMLQAAGATAAAAPC